MEVCVDSYFHHCYLDRGCYSFFIISYELEIVKERGERLLLSFLCSKTYNFILKLYTIFLRKYIIGDFDMGLCHLKSLEISH